MILTRYLIVSSLVFSYATAHAVSLNCLSSTNDYQFVLNFNQTKKLIKMDVWKSENQGRFTLVENQSFLLKGKVSQGKSIAFRGKSIDQYKIELRFPKSALNSTFQKGQLQISDSNTHLGPQTHRLVCRKIEKIVSKR